MFEFDPNKSEANLKKHGIDFIESQQIWEDANHLVIPARTTDEPRFIIIGRIYGKHWSGVFTLSGDRIRIISVRRSRPEEIQLYEG